MRKKYWGGAGKPKSLCKISEFRNRRQSSLVLYEGGLTKFSIRECFLVSTVLSIACFVPQVLCSIATVMIIIVRRLTPKLYQATWECPTDTLVFTKYVFKFVSPQLLKMASNHLFITPFALYTQIRHTATFFFQHPVPTFNSDTKTNCNDLAWITLTSRRLSCGIIMKALFDLCLQELSVSPLKSLLHLSTLWQDSGANRKSQLEREWKLVSECRHL